MTEVEQVSAKWAETQAKLPEGWTLDGLRCASTGLEPTDRSDDWVAVARGPGGAERSVRAATPSEALDELAAGLDSQETTRA